MLGAVAAVQAVVPQGLPENLPGSVGMRVGGWVGGLRACVRSFEREATFEEEQKGKQDRRWRRDRFKKNRTYGTFVGGLASYKPHKMTFCRQRPFLVEREVGGF